METKTTVPPNVYQTATGHIISLLEKGIVPWKQSWEKAGMPVNLYTKRPYRGINLMLLNSLGYDKNIFATSRQLKKLDVHIKKGEKGNKAVFWHWPDKTEQPPEDIGEPVLPVLDSFNLFNVSQCTDIPDQFIPGTAKDIFPIDACKKVVEEMPNKPRIIYNETRSLYNPLTDEIHMPDVAQFISDEGYYLMLFHQIVHASGRWNRTNRKGLLEMSEYTGQPFSGEELVNDIATAQLAFHCGLEIVYEPNADYIDGWLFRLKHDNRIIIQAASLAQRAVDYILNIDRSNYEIMES